jgi:hypothetical protein
MTKIIYKGKTPRMVAGKFMFTGDVRDVNPKIAAGFVGNADFVVETPSILPPSASPLPPNSESANLREEKEEQERNLEEEKVEAPVRVTKRGKRK